MRFLFELPIIQYEVLSRINDVIYQINKCIIQMGVPKHVIRFHKNLCQELKDTRWISTIQTLLNQ